MFAISAAATAAATAVAASAGVAGGVSVGGALAAAVGAAAIPTAAAGLGTGAALGAAAAGIGAGALTGSAIGAGLGAGIAGITGGDVGKGALSGAVTGAVGGGIAPGLGEVTAGLGSTASGALTGGVTGAAGGAAGAAATGEDAGKAALMGGAIGGIGGGIGGYMNAGEDASTLADIADEGGSTAAVGAGDGVKISPADLPQTALNPDIPIAFEPTQATMSSGEMSSALRQPVTTSAPPMGAGSYGSNTAAINAVNATPQVSGATPSTPSLSGYIDKGIKLIKDNPAVAIQAGGALLASAGGSDQQEAPPETVYPYTPSTYVPPAIQKTTVPQYYNPTGSYGYTGGYAEGGVINSAQPNGFMNNTQPNGVINSAQPNGFMNNTQPNGAMNGAQPNGPMNPIVARAMEQVNLQQAQQGQQPQIPPTQPPTPQGIMGAQTQPQFIVMPQQQQPMGQPMGSMPQPVGQPVGQPMGQPVGQFTQPPMGQPAGENVSQPTQMAAHGGMMRDNLGGYSHGGIAGLTRGPGDGVSDSIPAQIGDSGKQPARLADGEFVVPSRIVSELGNGSTEAGAKALQAMVDRIQARRSKTVGKGKVAVNSRARKELA